VKKTSIILSSIALVAVYSFADQQKLTVHFFGSRTCGECAEIKTHILSPLAKNNPDIIDMQYHVIENEKDFQLMVELEEKYNVPQSSPQELYVADTFLIGYESIIENAKPVIESYLNNPKKWKSVSVSVDTSKISETIKKRFHEFTFLGILAAGLIDGVNPCAIATMIFLISFLATQKRRRSEILTIGLAFTITVFFTYLLMGLGAFKMLTLLKSYHWISKAIRWSAVAAALVVAFLSFRDAFVFGRSKKSSDIKLQLPKAVKMRIHSIISENLSGTRLVIGSVITGFLVTLLEAICTGQVYLPTIVLMTRQSGLRLTGWLYLIFYNFLFVLPLLIVMILAYFGLKWNELSKTTQKHLPLLKTLLGIVLVGLALFLAVAG
jgi:cytochrome c biogenesis protein CcdA